MRKNRLAPPPKTTINGQDIFVSAKRGPEELPAEVIEDLLLTDNASDGDKWKGELRPCDRIWQAYQERGGSKERWMFRNVTEPNLRAALKAKGYL